jgi:thioredoxin reductase (NADPH)
MRWNTVIDEIEGDNIVRRLKLHNVTSGEKSALEVAGVFISIGFRPNTDFVKGLLPLDETGHIIANERLETDIPGVFAAGDVRRASARQAITAAGDGATAAIYAEKFIAEHNGAFVKEEKGHQVTK